MMNEAKRLYDLGFGVHWLKARSKAPVKGKWSSPTRDDWATVKRDYRPEYGLGVRLGEPSKVGSGYLCVIDVDIKSEDPRHKREAFAAMDAALPGARSNCACVQTGRGFHFYARTKTPLPSGKIKTSNEEVKVHSPTSEINKRQESKLTKDELARGIRVKNAWEVDFMSIGKQVVLPPTLHPDTGKAYKWFESFESIDELPFISPPMTDTKTGPGRPAGSTVIQNFKAVSVDLVSSKLSDRIVSMILSGQDVDDRSAACFSVAIAMLKAGMTDNEIMSVLTDRSTYLGETSFDHRKTDNRANAAAWVRDYCIVKAREMIRADRAFEDECGVTPILEDENAIELQLTELTVPGDWTLLIARSGPKGDGPPKPTLENVVLVLRNAVGDQIFKRDLFALRDFYGMDTPWGGRSGAILSDDDAVMIKMWISEHYRFEPSIGVVFEAMTVISIGNGFHPIKHQLEELPPWDGISRLDTWLARHFGAENTGDGASEYLAQVFRKWMVASITRIYEPGHKFDWMIIFEGEQDIGKSSFGRLLFGDKYFTDWMPDLHDKDAALALLGIQCVEFGELATLRKNELDIVKAFVTRQVDKVRPPYGRKTIECARQCVFFGTTNRDEYLQDDTGNRRFNPVKVSRLDFGALARDRDQLFAEAVFIYQNKLENALYLEGPAIAYAKELQASKMVRDDADIMAEKFQDFIDENKLKDPSERFNLGRFKMSDLFMGFGPFAEWKNDSRNHRFAARVLTRFGYQHIRTKHTRFWGPK